MKNKLLKHLRIHRKIIKDFGFIQKYLEGELHGENLIKFIYRIQSDHEFASEVDSYRELNDFIMNKENCLQMSEPMQQIYQELVNEGNKKYFLRLLKYELDKNEEDIRGIQN
jgi:hypothetical protein